MSNLEAVRIIDDYYSTLLSSYENNNIKIFNKFILI